MVITYLQGRKITIEHDGRLPPIEIVHLIRKLRWIGMEDEAEQLQMKIQEATPIGGVIHCRARNELTTSLLQAWFA